MQAKINILIADDNNEFTFILKEYLNVNGLSVCAVASDGIETLSMIQKHQPDIVILDIMMPMLDGIGVLKRVKKLDLNKKTHFIILSAFENAYLRQTANDMGVDTYICKPFDMNKLLSSIKKMQESILSEQADTAHSILPDNINTSC